MNTPAKIYSNLFCIVCGGDGGGGKTYYCNFEFGATSFVMVCDLHEKFQSAADDFARFYLAVVLSERLFQTIQHGRTISDIPQGIEVLLPVQDNNEIDWAAMSAFVRQWDYAVWF